MASFDLSQIRQDFPILDQSINGRRLVYLDSAATALKPKPVVNRLAEFYLLQSSNVHRGAHFLADQATRFFEEARDKVRDFIHAKESAEIIFTKGTTEALNLVAASLGRQILRPGDEILLTEMEHHSNLVPWQMAAQAQGCIVKFAPVKLNGELDMEAFRGLLNNKTKIVSIAHTSNVLGTINAVEEIISLGHSVGAKVILDAAQAVSNQTLDVQDLDCDFLAFSAHKMFGPFGIGVLYGKKELLSEMPPYQGGGSMIEHVSFEKTTYNVPPYRFEAGTPPIAEAVGLAAAIDYIENHGGVEPMFEHEQDLLKHATDRLQAIEGIHLVGTAFQKCGILSFVMKGAHPSDVASVLDQEGVAVRSGHHCCEPLMKKLGVPGTVRAAFSIYNDLNDVELLASALEKARRFFS